MGDGLMLEGARQIFNDYPGLLNVRQPSTCRRGGPGSFRRYSNLF